MILLILSFKVLSGDMKGRILVWWLKRTESRESFSVLRRCQVHSGPVKCMQFDAVHIVSGGADSLVVITDIATGEKLQTLVGHGPGPVLALAFDLGRIVSVGVDNTMRYWQWGARVLPKDKFHLLDKGQSLSAVCKLYSLSLEELLRWNGITDMRNTYVGMKLIVRKGDPSRLTDAEKLAEQKETKRLLEAAAAANRLARRDKAVGSGLEKTGEGLGRYDRVHKLATDIDFFSLGNRMFRNEKRQTELFPDRGDPNRNPHALSVRLQRDPAKQLLSSPEGSRGSGGGVGRFYLSADNEEEWRDGAEQLALSMLSLLVEYEAYSLVLEQKKALSSSGARASLVSRFSRRFDQVQPQLQIETSAGEGDGKGEEISSMSFPSLERIEEENNDPEKEEKEKEEQEGEEQGDLLPHGVFQQKPPPSPYTSPRPEEISILENGES